MTAPAQTPETDSPVRRSYGQIVKSSAIIGGATVLNIGFAMVRTKAMALLLGTEAYGLFGLYTAVYDVTRSLAGMGVNSSGVRQIAEAVGTQDQHRIATTVITLRRVAFWTGALGALLLLSLCAPVAWLTFKDTEHAGAIALLALAVFFGDISAGQAALVQGMRRIADLARMNVLGALYGTLFSIPLIYFFRERGIVPSLVMVAGMSILTSWWYARRIQVATIALTLKQTLQEVSALLRLGLVFMSTMLMTMLVGYLVRVLVLREISLEASGYYDAAWRVGSYYFSIILGAMGTDFYPRLTAVARDNAECNRLVNEQAEVGLLLAGPAVLAALACAPLLITILYSTDFGPAVAILRWIFLGMLLRVACWPMGYILVAKGEGRLFFWTELVANALQVALVWAGLRILGLQGTGVAFFSLYVLYGAGIYLVVRNVSGFRWSSANKKLALIFAPVVWLMFAACHWLPLGWVLGAGVVVTLTAGYYSLKTLCALVSLDRLPRVLRRFLSWLRLAPAADNH